MAEPSAISSSSASPKIGGLPPAGGPAAPVSSSGGQIQYFVFDAIAFDSVFRSAVSNSSSANLVANGRFMDSVDRATGIDNATGGPNDYSSHYTWLWQHPGATVNLYFTQNLPGFAQTINVTGNSAAIKTNVDSNDLKKLAEYERNRDNVMRADALKRSADLLDKLGLHFDESIFTSGQINRAAVLNRLKTKGISDQAAEAAIKDLSSTARYLQNWYENISRITQPVSGVQYEKIVRNQLKAKKGNMTSEELAEAAITIPAPVLSRRLQMIQGEKIVALKESLHGTEAANIRAGQKPTNTTRDADYFNSARVDGDFLIQFSEKYGHLLGGSIINHLIGGEHEEVMVDADGNKITDPKTFLAEYGRRLRGSGKTLSLALNPNDSEADRAAKLYLQSAISLWEPGTKEDFAGALQRYAGDTERLGAGYLIGMDETTINYPLRFKAALLRLGFQAGPGFSLTDPATKGNLTTEQIHFMADRFEKFWTGPNMTAEGRRQFAEALEVSEQTIEGYVRTMKGATADFNDFKYASNNQGDLGRALVFFTQNIIPSFVPTTEGESDSNLVDLPLHFAQKTKGVKITDLSFARSGGTEAIDSETGPSETGWTGQLTGAVAKGLHFSLFLHPTIQLGLQGGFLVKLGRALTAGDDKQVGLVFKEWARTRLNFFAFTYNPLALLRSGINNIEKGNAADGVVDLTFALGFIRILKHQFQNLKKAYNFLAQSRGWKPLTTQADEALPREFRLLTERVIDESTANTKLRWNLKRALTTGKDFVFEPLTTSMQLLDLSLMEQHKFWRNLIDLANGDPNRLVSVDGFQVGEKTVSFKMRAGDMLAIYRQAISPSVYNRAIHGLTQFLGIPETNYTVGHAINVLSQPLTRNERIIRNLAADNAEAIRTGNLNLRQINSIVGQLSSEAGLVAGGEIKVAGGGKALRAFRWFTFKFLLQTDENKIKMNQIEGKLKVGEHFYGSRAAMGKDLAAQLRLIEKDLLTKKGGLSAEFNDLHRAIAEPMIQHEYQSLLEQLPPNLSPKARAKAEAQALRQAQASVQQKIQIPLMDSVNYAALQQVYDNLDQHFTPDEIKTINEKQNGILTKQQFDKAYQAEKPAIIGRMREVKNAFVNRQTKPGGSPMLQEINRALPEVSEVLPKDALARIDQPVEETGSARQPRVIIDAEFAEPVVTPPPFELNAALRETGMNVEINGSLDNLPLETQRQFVDAVHRAKERGMEKLTIRPEVKFAGGGEAALANLNRVLNSDSVPRTLDVVVHNNQVHFKGPNVSIPGTLMIIPLQSDMAAGVNGSGTTQQIEPGKPLTVDQIAERFKVSKTEAQAIASEAKGLRSGWEKAKSDALARIDSLPVSDQEKARMRQVATESWNRDMSGVETALVEKRAIQAQVRAQKSTIVRLNKELATLRTELRGAHSNPTERLRLQKEIATREFALEGIRRPLASTMAGFVKNHGPMLGIVLGVDVAMMFLSEEKLDAKDVAARIGGALGGYFVFAAGEQALTKVLSLAEGKGGPLTGAALGVAVAVMRHQDHLRSSNLAVRQAALADIAKEGISGYLAVKVGAVVAAPLAENPLLAAIAGFAAGAITYSAIEFGGEALGYKQWLDQTMTAGEITDAMDKISASTRFLASRGFSGIPGMQLSFANPSTDLAYFNQATEAVTIDGQQKMVSKGQYFLGFWQAAANFAQMSPAKQAEFIKQNGEHGKELAAMLRTAGQINNLDAGSHEDLEPETFSRIGRAIEQYREENHIPANDTNTAYRFNVKVRTRTENIMNPLTGEVVGSRKIYTINVLANRYTMGAWGDGALNRFGLDDSYKAPAGSFDSEKIDGNPQKLQETALLMQSADPQNQGQFNLSLQDLVSNKMSLPFAKLDSLPLVKQELATRLAHNGFDPRDNEGNITTGSIMVAYLEYTKATNQGAGLRFIPAIGLQQPAAFSFSPTLTGQPAKGDALPFYQLNRPIVPTGLPLTGTRGAVSPLPIRLQSVLGGQLPAAVTMTGTGPVSRSSGIDLMGTTGSLELPLSGETLTRLMID